MSIPSSSSLSSTFPPDESRPYIPSLTATSTSAFLEEPLPSTEPLPTETVPTFAPKELDLVRPEETSQICNILGLAMLASGIIDENRNDAPSTQVSWNCDIEEIFRIPEAPVRKEAQSSRVITTHRVLTSDDIIRNKQEKEGKKREEAAAKEERKRAREEKKCQQSKKKKDLKT
ncbi:hypothetical protein PoB_004441300 [Plakobranchus ocellatus]|uniref:Uncharacterized protein n=1 Tax=Plakobranchus ocellatus TaxID=259542 RepID=A0AAV4BGD9_9GAST|nr:hypothetical protein PoB_004441300 [Plakobranchus ocellatus]